MDDRSVIAGHGGKLRVDVQRIVVSGESIDGRLTLQRGVLDDFVRSPIRRLVAWRRPLLSAESALAADDAANQSALDDTTRVEGCVVSLASGIDCPGATDPAWVIFDDTDKPGGKPANADWVKSFGQVGAHEEFELPLDWDDDQYEGAFLILVANNDNASAIFNGGYCHSD